MCLYNFLWINFPAADDESSEEDEPLAKKKKEAPGVSFTTIMISITLGQQLVSVFIGNKSLTHTHTHSLTHTQIT